MSPDFVVGFMSEVVVLILSISLPMLMTGLVVGIFVSVIQAATQIQEMTLTFIPKIIAIFGVLILAFPLLMDKLNTFTINLLINIPNYI